MLGSWLFARADELGEGLLVDAHSITVLERAEIFRDGIFADQKANLLFEPFGVARVKRRWRRDLVDLEDDAALLDARRGRSIALFRQGKGLSHGSRQHVHGNAVALQRVASQDLLVEVLGDV